MKTVREAFQGRSWLLPLGLWGLFFLSLGALVALAEDVYEKEGFAFDLPLLAFFHGLQSPFLDHLALAITHSASAGVIIPLALVVTAAGYRLGLPWLDFLLSFGGANLLDQAAKLAFARARPHLFPQLTPEHDFSFPSGHSVAALALVLGVYLLLRRRFPKAAALALSLGLPWAFLVGLSRVFLQVHYPSDVLAGWALATAWTLAVWALRKG
ncbi:phosphatase PAP2 family protein [Thermus albus]|uniref:phosphatase PAP2 family protein n=1 Tax=Thermus albus TaxID=2908146 RepID=UPI001FAAA5C6|nr:phosphatase PAP2 family protein [Thermus albus]